MLTLGQIIEREGRIRQARRLIAEAQQSLRQAPLASRYDGMRIGSVQRQLDAALDTLEDITVLDDGDDEIDDIHEVMQRYIDALPEAECERLERAEREWLEHVESGAYEKWVQAVLQEDDELDEAA
ncbi:hypothetical protein NYR54_04910 [Chelativorans sp. SCAU2101]|uniref:Uncharacterized protein n=1 Tax=Chelativorans petroleitrophicus TaxID=2975484 RepID=A0A9X2X7Q6_9HYPH|nr:hypothetical protein [Chelativorans petroleitrophicus]MCT8989636.1 hypothetical protein [Chelativorans petroleitrophicus]